MADKRAFEILQQGVEAWNTWRSQRSDVTVDLKGIEMSEADLAGIKLYRTDLSGANLNNSNLSHANLSDADLYRTQLKGADLSHAKLYKAYLEDANLEGAILVYSMLGNATLDHANFTSANLSYANLEDAKLEGTTFVGANLSQARLDGAYGSPNMSEANLAQAFLWEVSLIGADFRRACLYEAEVTESMLRQANMENADLREAFFDGCSLYKANLRGADLRNASLENAVLNECNLQDAILSGCSVFGVAAWNVGGTPKKQSDLNIARYGHPPILVHDIEVAQFINLLLDHKKLRNALNAITKKGVLLLGQFSNGGLEMLQAVASQLRALDYLPIIFDFERPDNRDYTETVLTLAGLSRFVIVEISGPSVPQELYAIVPHLSVPFVPILRAGQESYSMFTDLSKYQWVVNPPVIFQSDEELLKLLQDKIIAPAEERLRDKQKSLDDVFGKS